MTVYKLKINFICFCFLDFAFNGFQSVKTLIVKKKTFCNRVKKETLDRVLLHYFQE